MKQKVSITLAFFAVGTFSLMRWSTGWPAGTAASAPDANQQRRVVQPSQRPAGDSRQSVEQEVEVKQSSVLRSQHKPSVPVATDLDISSMYAGVTVADLNHSMKQRRDYAWNIVRKVWKPINVPGGKIPTWMTWYEQEDIAELYKEMISKPQPSTRAAISGRVTALLRSHSNKSLQTSLASARLGKVLRQFRFGESLNTGPNKKPSTGNIYYSPAYVKHLLENASSIAKCDPSAFPKPSVTLSRQRPMPMGIEDVPVELRPKDPNNLYALCMDHEMPRDAVMIKAAWAPRADGALQYNLGYQMAAGLIATPAGQWILPPGNEKWPYHGPDSEYLTITDENGKKWALMGMHIVSKNLRTWMWTTLFWGQRGWNWAADQPQAIKQEVPELSNYGMATASDYKESDPTPWKAYDGKGDDSKGERLQSLADTLKAVHGVMKGAQWCSNPYIETNMARGNCIGCHQGSTESFLPTTLFERQRFNVSDFSFSFATNRAMIKDLMRQQRLRPQTFLKPK